MVKSGKHKQDKKDSWLRLGLILVMAVGICGLLLVNYFLRNQLTQIATPQTYEVISYQPKTIIAVGDIVCDTADKYFNNGSGSDSRCMMQKTYELAKSLNPQRVLALGDLQYNKGEYTQFTNVYNKSWGQFKAITNPAPGNHEYETPSAAGYYDFFNGPAVVNGQAGQRGAGYYSFDLGSWHVIALNSNCKEIGGCNAGSAQYQWLSQDLQDNQRTCTLAFWHHPRFSSGNYADQPTELSRSAGFWDQLFANKADLVLNGHDHIYERFAPQRPDGSADAAGITQFTIGTGGKQLYQQKSRANNSQIIDTQNYGVLKLKLSKNSYRWQFITTDNSIIDEGANRCSE